MADLWVHSFEGGGWNPNFSRSLNDWEIRTVECFLSRIQDKVVVEERENGCFVLLQRVDPFLLSPFISSLRK